MAIEFGLKELYDVTIKSTYPIEVSGRKLEVGEVICAFDKIQIANIQEVKNATTARGGWDNRGQVFWDSTREVRLNFTQGIFSKTQLAILTGMQLITEAQAAGARLSCREVVESNEEGTIVLAHAAESPIFLYNASTGTKVDYTVVDATHLHIETPFLSVIVDYSYNYDNNYKVLMIGQALTSGYMALEGKSRVKDDETGQTHTVVLQVPRLKLMSDLSMRLGEKAAPQIGRFDALAVPTGDRWHTETMRMYFLDDDIDSDM